MGAARKIFVLGIVFAVIAVIGLIRYIGGMTSVNIGIFIFPGIISAVLLVFAWRRRS